MKRLTSILGVVTLLVFIHIEGRACTCDLPMLKQTSLKQQVNKARNQSQAVFVGKVIEIVQNPQDYFVLVRFNVERSWKGSLAQEVSVVTGQGGGDCGYKFEFGETYLVYAYGDKTRLGTNICQRTANLSAAEADVKVLGKGRSSAKM